MYQYACMPTFILNLETLEVGNFVHFPPAVPPLVKFLPQDEFDAEMERIQKEKEVCWSTGSPSPIQLSYRVFHHVLHTESAWELIQHL